MSDNEKQKKQNEVLVKLIMELSPFLDSSGKTFVIMPHNNEKIQITEPLRSSKVRCILTSRYKKKCKSFLRPHSVLTPISFVEGCLLENRKNYMVDGNYPPLKCLNRFIEEEGEYSGSAHDILDRLRDVNKKYGLLKGTEKLPENPTAMGKWMTKNQLLLQANCFEVSRPSRSATKRLWYLRKIIRDDDASDTSMVELSGEGSLSKSNNFNENELNDKLTEKENLILKEALS